MRILILNTAASLSGVPTQLLGMRREFERQGHEAVLWWLRPGSLTERTELGPNERIGPAADAWRLMADEPFDVVQTTNYDHGQGFTAIREVFGCPVFSMAAGVVSRYWHAGNCGAVICVSRWLADRQRRWSDAPVPVVYNGIDTTLFCPGESTEPSRPIVLWVGRLHSRAKRVELLLAVAPLLTRAGYRLWVLTGSRPDDTPEPIRAVLARHAERWEALSQPELAQAYRDAAASGGCVLSTSRSEGLPQAQVEAQACGCPVVGPNVRGVNEAILAEYGGVLVAADPTAEDVVAAIDGVVKDPRGTAWRGELGRRLALERFDRVTMARGYLAQYARAHRPRRDLAAIAGRLRERLLARRDAAHLERLGNEQAAIARVADELRDAGRDDLGRRLRAIAERDRLR